MIYLYDSTFKIYSRMTTYLSNSPLVSIVAAIFYCAGFLPETANGQKVYQEGKVVYKIEAAKGVSDPAKLNWIGKTSYTLTIKGSLTRTEMKTDAGATITIHDGKLKTGAMINDYGNQKILIRMTEADLKDRDKHYEGMQVEFRDEKRTIAGYECQLALVKLKNGTTYRVYYAPALQFQNQHYDSPFHELPGFPLEYEAEMGKDIYRFVAQEVDFSSIPSALFDLPKTGYKEMSYSEVKKLQGN